MGCASSQPADKASGPGVPAQNVQQATLTPGTPEPVPTGNSPVTVSPQPLYAAQQSPQQAQATPAPVNRAPAPVQQALNGSAVQQQAPTQQAQQQQQQQLRRRDSDEESDWDQCSTSHYDLEADDAKVDRTQATASVMEKAQHSSLYAEQQVLNYDQPLNYKETSILRIDKVKGCMFVNQYLVVKFLGRGACGKVFLCLNTHDLRLYAMKAVRKVDLEASQASQQNQPGAKPKRNPMEDLKREIMIMKKMKHTNIVMLSEVIDDPAGSKLLLVMEFMEGGPVLTREALEKRERLPEPLALQYFRDMVKALDYLHSHKVVHGDLKPENVLMAASSDVKLSDFGCSKVFATGNEYLERCNGTPAFLAPEMMKPNTRYRGRPTDVYALGACLYTLIFGRIPFSAPNLYKLFQVVQNEPVRYPEDVPISDALRHLLGAMLIKNPRERITLSEVMRHPWTTMGGHFPLRPTRELKMAESQEQHDGIPGGHTFAQCHPRPDFLAGLAMSSRHERAFNEGDCIMRQGDAGTYLMYIVQGTVDVLVKWTQPPRRAPSAQSQPGANSGGAPGSAGRAGGGGADELGVEDNDTMSPITDEEGRQHRLNLARAAGKAREFIRSLQSASGNTRDLLVAQRGAGELVGEMALFSKSLARCATVRCATRVVARIITHEQLVEFLMQQPAAKHQIREGIWKKESEITMVEALVKLANVQDIISASLDEAPTAMMQQRAVASTPGIPPHQQQQQQY